MIWKTPEYNGGSGVERGGDCGALVNYLSRSGEVDLYDHCGREMDDQERNEFVRESQTSEMQRDLVLSPKEGVGENMTDDEMSLRARQTLNKYFEDKPEASYAFAIHRDTEIDHVQVAVHGNFDSIKMFSEQFDDMDEAVEQAQWQEREEQIKEQQAKEQRQQAGEAQEAESASLSQSISQGGV